MKDYASMSDFEINKEVSMTLLDKSANPSARYVAIGDYCNNPADAWPIIQSNGISIEFRRQFNLPPIAKGEHSQQWHDDKNPLRSAMIVFLMMKESEND